MPPSTINLSLGIDIGTTKVAAVIVDPRSREVLSAHAVSSNSDITTKAGRHEQDVKKVLDYVIESVLALPSDQRSRVSTIGVTGQMHGVVLWDPATKESSTLITWQDKRCEEDGFIEKLQIRTGDKTVQTGYGNASIAWLTEHEPNVVRRYKTSGTIHDYLVSILCGLDRAVTDPSDAASWGFFDLRSSNWKFDLIERSSIPSAILPEVRATGSVIGNITKDISKQWGISEKTQVVNALGDNQAALYCSLSDPTSQIALTIGTGGQLSVVVPKLPDEQDSAQRSFEYRPYVNGTFAAVAPALTGGNVNAALMKMVEQLLLRLGVKNISEETIYNVLHQDGLEKKNTTMTVTPTLLGERHIPTSRGSIEGISLSNFTVGDIQAGFARGIIRNMKEMLPPQLLSGKKEIVGTGNAIRRSVLMQEMIKEELGLPLKLTDGREETASGAAYLAAEEVGKMLASHY